MADTTKTRKPRLKRYRDFRTWMSFDSHRSFITASIRRLKPFFVPQAPGFEESFDEAMQRYNIDEATLQDRMRAFRRVALFMLLIAALSLAGAIYLLVQLEWRSALIALALVCFSSGLAFRYHFWYFQIKRRKLGCTFKEWLRNLRTH